MRKYDKSKDGSWAWFALPLGYAFGIWCWVKLILFLLTHGSHLHE